MSFKENRDERKSRYFIVSWRVSCCVSYSVLQNKTFFYSGCMCERIILRIQ